jgi:polysaccharide export outer membrane protein
MHILLIIFVIFLTSCTPLPYSDTTYGIDEFISDSSLIYQGKQSIQQMEESKLNHCLKSTLEPYEIELIDGDILSIVLYCPNRPDRVRNLQIINDHSGYTISNHQLCLPELPPIDVRGLTLNQARSVIESNYQEQLPDAQIFVDFKKRKTRYVQIIGAKIPFVEVDGKVRLSEVIAKAKLPINANYFKSYVLRKGCQLPIDLNKLIVEGDDSQNIVMRGGDKIYIAQARDSVVMVMGEVHHPIVYPLPHGFVPLRDAIAHASGIPFTGSDCGIYVIRGNFKRPKIYHLSWQEIRTVPNNSLLLMEGDVVYIAERRITDWNRFISQLQPTLLGFQTGYNSYNMIIPISNQK